MLRRRLRGRLQLLRTLVVRPTRVVATRFGTSPARPPLIVWPESRDAWRPSITIEPWGQRRGTGKPVPTPPGPDA